MNARLRVTAVTFAMTCGLAILAGCGGNASPAPTTSTPTSPATTPPSAPAPSPAPTPTPPPTTSGATTQFRITLSGQDQKPHGTLSVDTAGDIHLALTNAKPGTYLLTFQSWNSGGWTSAAMEIATVIVDANGNANGTFHFPQSGTWVGDFSVNVGSNAYVNDWAYGSLASYQAILVQAKYANAGRGSQRNSNLETVPQDQLGSGTVTVTNGKVEITVKGAAPNVTYYAGSCGQQCYAGTPFTTDANGNGSVSFTLNAAPGGDIFDIYRYINNTAGAVAGFDSGFKVP
jgi:hypothetical protein